MTTTVSDNLINAPKIRAFVRFNGSTMAIADSYNITSLTDNGVGDYTLNFTNAMPNANYTYLGTGTKNAGGAVAVIVGLDTVAPTTTALRVQCLTSSTITTFDGLTVNVAVLVK